MNMRPLPSPKSVLLPFFLAGLTGAGAQLPATVPAGTPAASRPHVIAIVLDDVGFSDLGCFGSEIHTPNIDRLARSGLRYTRFDTNALCSPTRAAFLTGRNPQTVRMSELPSRLPRPDPTDMSSRKGELPGNVETVAQALQRVGYATAALGKWHLAPMYETGEPDKNASFPLQRGFEYFYGFRDGWTDQYHPELFDGNQRIPAPTKLGYHLTEDLIDHAISLLQSNQVKSPQRPTFIYLALGVAHAPLQAPQEYINHYKSVYQKGWDAVRSERFARQKQMGLFPPDTVLPAREQGDPSWESLTDQQQRVYARFMATYAGFLEHGDTQIGRLLDYLDQSGLAKNTLILLFSDNGAASESKKGIFFRQRDGEATSLSDMETHLDELGTDKTQPLYQRPWAFAGDTPFRRYKLWPYLGGVRTPLIITWPGVIPNGGGYRRQYVNAIDLAPTILAAAGTLFANEVDGQAQIPVAGSSILPTLLSSSAPSSHEVQFFELRANRAITSGPWRAVAIHRNGTDSSKDRWKLFDVSKDPTESNDLADTNPAKLKELIKLWWGEAERYGDLPLTEAPFIKRPNIDNDYYRDEFNN